MQIVKEFMAALLATCLLSVLVACGGGGTSNGDKTGNIDNTTAKLSKLNISFEQTTLTVQSSLQIGVQAEFDNGESQDITADVSWAIDKDKIASINSDGNITSKNYIDQFTITANYLDQTVSQKFTVTKKANSTLSNVTFNDSVDLNNLIDSDELIVVGVYSDNSIAENLVVKIESQQNNGNNKIVRLKIAESIFTATVDTTTTTATLNITLFLQSINLSLSASTVKSGSIITASAAGVFDDDSIENPLLSVTWSVVGPASVDTNGIISADTGVTELTEATITVSRDGVSASQTFNITAAPSAPDPTVILDQINILTNGSSTLAPGDVLQLSAVGKYSDNSTKSLNDKVTWSSLNANIASINSTGEIVGGNMDGTTTIEATFDGHTALFSVTLVTPPAPPALLEIAIKLNDIIINQATILKDSTAQLTLVALYSDSNVPKSIVTGVVWSSNKSSKISVDNQGLVSAIKGTQGEEVSISATFGGITKNVSFLLEFPPTLQSIQLAINQTNTSRMSLAIGDSANLSLYGVYSDSATPVEISSGIDWKSSKNAAVSISTSGEIIVLSGNQDEEVIITASIEKLTVQIVIALDVPLVLNTISINFDNTTFTVNSNAQISAFANYSDNSSIEITSLTGVSWQSSSNIISIDEFTGAMTASNIVGSGLITVNYKNKSAQLSVAVSAANNAVVSFIKISAFDNNLSPNSSVQLKVNATYSDGSTEDVTQSVTWSSIEPATASVSGGLLSTYNQLSSTTITASLESVNQADSVNINVLNGPNATPDKLIFEQEYLSIFENQTENPVLKLSYKNSNVELVMTDGISWATSNADVAIVDTNGNITSLTLDALASFGKVNIVANYLDSGDVKIVPEAVISVQVSKKGDNDYIDFNVNNEYEKAHIEDGTSAAPTVKAFYNNSGLLPQIPMTNALPGIFITGSGNLLKEKIALAINGTDAGTYDKTAATMTFTTHNRIDGDFYSIDESINTSLNITLDVYPGIGSITTGAYNAILCHNAAILNNTCDLPQNRISINGTFIATIEADTNFQCYSSTTPKFVDKYLANSKQQICNTELGRSFYQLETIPGVDYEISATTNNADVSVVAFRKNGERILDSNNGVTRTLILQAEENYDNVTTPSGKIENLNISNFSFDYRASAGTLFDMSIAAKPVAAEGSSFSPVLIEKTIPINTILRTDDTQSYYKIAVVSGRLYSLSSKVFAQMGNTVSNLKLLISSNSDFSNAQVCSTGCRQSQAVRATSGFLYVQLDGPQGGTNPWATLKLTIEYQSDRDPTNYEEFLNLELPISGFLGQAGRKDKAPDGSILTTQGSGYSISGIAANTYYLVKVSGVTGFTRLWINNWFPKNLVQDCNSIGNQTVSEFYCIVKTGPELFNGTGNTAPSFPVNIVAAGNSGTPLILDVTEIPSSNDIFYVSTFANGSSGRSGTSITEIALYHPGETVPFLVSADNYVKYTSKPFYLPSGETIDIVVNDTFNSGNAYSIQITRDGTVPISRNARPENPDSFELNNDDNRANATPLSINEISDHSLSENGGDFDDFDWFTFTAP